jgi:hypothetical protein
MTAEVYGMNLWANSLPHSSISEWWISNILAKFPNGIKILPKTRALVEYYIVHAWHEFTGFFSLNKSIYY